MGINRVLNFHLPTWTHVQYVNIKFWNAHVWKLRRIASWKIHISMHPSIYGTWNWREAYSQVRNKTSDVGVLWILSGAFNWSQAETVWRLKISSSRVNVLASLMSPICFCSQMSSPWSNGFRMLPPDELGPHLRRIPISDLWADDLLSSFLIIWYHSAAASQNLRTRSARSARPLTAVWNVKFLSPGIKSLLSQSACCWVQSVTSGAWCGLQTLWFYSI